MPNSTEAQVAFGKILCTGTKSINHEERTVTYHHKELVTGITVNDTSMNPKEVGVILCHTKSHHGNDLKTSFGGDEIIKKYLENNSDVEHLNNKLEGFVDMCKRANKEEGSGKSKV